MSVQLHEDLVEYWNLGEASGTRVGSHAGLDLDDSGATGGSFFYSRPTALFAGTTNLNRVSSAPLQVNGGVPLSFTAWVKLNSFTTDQWTVAGKGTSANGVDYTFDYVNFGSSPAGGFVFRMGAAYDYELGSSVPALSFPSKPDIVPVIGEWFFLAGVYDGTTISFWINNIFVTSVVPNPSLITPQTSRLSVGARVTAAGAQAKNLDGAVWGVGLWSRALTEAEIGYLWNSGAGLLYPLVLSQVTTPLRIAALNQLDREVTGLTLDPI